jgi:hypothetical protein
MLLLKEIIGGIMSVEKNKTINLPLLLPLGLLILEIVAVIVLLGSGYEIPGLLFILLFFLGIFLIYQIYRQLWAKYQMKKAVTAMKNAQESVNAGKPMEAIEQWKRILPNLPREQYLDTLIKMERAYESQDMDNAVQQVRAVQSESIEFFEMSKVAQQFTPKDRRKWQAKAFKLQKMISALPVEKEQDLGDIEPETQGD